MVGAALICVGMVVVVFAFVMAIVLVSDMAALSSGFGSRVSSNESGEVPSHLTQKCKTRVNHKATTAGELFSRFLYQSSASKSDLQWR
jgi:hypothetical protein